MAKNRTNLPDCEGCGEKEYSIGRMNNYTCDNCGFMPRVSDRRKIQNELGESPNMEIEDD